MEVPTPVSIHAADVCRDGGTYVLVYSDAAGTQYELELPVILGEAGRMGYRAPSLKSYQYGNSMQLSWAQAERLAQVLRPLLIEPIKWGGLARATGCVSLLSLGGGLADEA